MSETSFLFDFIVAVIGGILSFISPCVLPLVPAYLSFLAGYHEHGNSRKKSNLVLQSASFVLGFSLIFISLGIAAASVGGSLLKWQGVFGWISGGVLIVLGIHTLGFIRISALMRDTRPQWHHKKLGVITSFIAGLAFGMGWTPCIGPILAGILTLAANSNSAEKGALLLMGYAAGLGLPFMITAFGIERFHLLTSPLKKRMKWVEWISGFLLITTGLLILMGGLSNVSNFVIQWIPVLSRLG